MFRVTKTEFTLFVEQTLEDLIRLAEDYTGKTLPRKAAFRWMGKEELVREAIVETIVGRVYIDEEHIYPCVDIGVGDLLEDGTPIIVANVSGHSARPFQKNWTGRDGPFVRIVGSPFLNKIAGKKVDTGAVFGYVIPDMKKPK